MPILDGKEALKGLLQLGYNKPVYALTANVMRNETTEYRQLGFTGTLTKPLDSTKLYGVLEAHLLPLTEFEHKRSVINTTLQTKITELKPVFIKTLSNQYQQMNELIKMDDFEEIVKILHVIKGSAGNFGYNSLTDQANVAMTSIRKKQFDDLANLIEQVMKTIEQILNSEKTCASKY
jgi:HPt (histidine-containing phosphotransfer) domain-containing protein